MGSKMSEELSIEVNRQYSQMMEHVYHRPSGNLKDRYKFVSFGYDRLFIRSGSIDGHDDD